ncbi:MAG: precorrin-2 dehydrogenase/sirohydrochlorin ferrochelatase family protein [Planctomycetota bacterium]
MHSLPIMVNVAGRRVVVIGAGDVGRRKVHALGLAGAHVRWVSLEPVHRVPEGVEHHPEPYHAGHVDGAMLVFACTDDAELNTRVAEDAHRIGAMVNVADVPELCDFYMPATVRRGPVTVAVGTGGASPALARRLKRPLSDALPSQVGEYATAVADLRQRIKQDVHDPDRRRDLLMALASEDAYCRFCDGGREGLERLLREL